MVRTHYPSYLKTMLKSGAIVHLLFVSVCLSLGWVKHRELSKNSKPRRRFLRAGIFDSNLQMRDEYQREIIRPSLDWQPNDAFINSRSYKPDKRFF